MKPFDGVCYDGPKEGEHAVCLRPSFSFPIAKETSYLRRPEEQIQYDIHTYRWCEPIRKWVFTS